MAETCETMTVKRKGNTVLINKEDFNSETDEKIKQDKASKPSKPKKDNILDILDGNIGEVVAEVGKIDSTDNLDKLLKAEHDGKTRIGVVDAIEFRKAELEEPAK